MKDLISLAREAPAAFVFLVILLLSGGYFSSVLSGNDIEVLKCEVIRLKKSDAMRDLYYFEEREKESPSADKRRTINKLKDSIAIYDEQLRVCK